MTLEQLTKDSFTRQLNTKFRLEIEPEKFVEVELVEVTVSVETERQECFAPVFRGSLDQFLPQRMYRTEHEGWESFDLFIVPIRRDGQGFYYEAVFNRVKQ